jgi:hypothetical protein
LCLILQQESRPEANDVERFALDDVFNYDDVKLTSKFTSAEIKAITGMPRLGPLYPVEPV